MSKQLSWWRGLAYGDWHRALLLLLPSLLAIVFTHLYHVPQAVFISLFLSILLMGLAGAGRGKLQQALMCSLTGGMFIAAVISAYLAAHLGSIWFYIFLGLSIFFWTVVPRLNLGLSNACLCAAIFFVFALGHLQASGDALITRTLYLDIYGIVWATGLLVVVNSVLPTVKYTIPQRICGKHFYRRALRVSLAVVLTYAVCTAFKLRHEEWGALAVLVVSQASLGATIKRSGQRLLGTLLGVVCAMPLMYYIFMPYPWARLLALPMLAAAWLWFKRSYGLAIFFVTLSLAALYFMLYPPQPLQALHYVAIRLLQTVLGIMILLLLEILFFPRRIIPEMRRDVQAFWVAIQQVCAPWLETPEGCVLDQHARQQSLQSLQQAQLHLQVLSAKLADYYYEPLSLLTRRYHAVSNLINHLYHFLYYLKAPQVQDTLCSVDAKQLHRFACAMAQQYSIQDYTQRYAYLRRLQQAWQQYQHMLATTASAMPKAPVPAAPHTSSIVPAAHQQACTAVVQAYLRLLRCQRLKFKWR